MKSIITYINEHISKGDQILVGNGWISHLKKNGSKGSFKISDEKYGKRKEGDYVLKVKYEIVGNDVVFKCQHNDINDMVVNDDTFNEIKKLLLLDEND